MKRSLLMASASGAADLARRLANVGKAARIAAAAKSTEIAAEMVEGMRSRVSVQSGRVRDSIRAEPNDDGTVTVRAGGTPGTARATRSGEVYDAAVLLEYGTVYQPPEPYFWPEVEAARERHGEAIFQAARKAAESA